MADARRSSSPSDYLALAKPRLNFLVVLTSAAGYYLGAVGRPDWLAMAQAVAGTAFVAGDAADASAPPAGRTRPARRCADLWSGAVGGGSGAACRKGESHGGAPCAGNT